MAINDSTNKYTPNSIVVDAAGTTPFTTVAQGIAAAVALGQPTTIYVRSGTYTENLTLIANVKFEGESWQDTIIQGTHTIPATGKVQFTNFSLYQTTPANNLFIEAGAGNCMIFLLYCTINIHSGILFNLPLSTGQLTIAHCNDISTANSIVNNTTGKSTVSIGDSIMGTGAVTALMTGTVSMNKATIGCPLRCGSDSVLNLRYSTFNNTLTLDDTAGALIYYSKFSTGGSAAITVNAGTYAILEDVSIKSSAGNIITGAGSVTCGQVTAVSAFTHNATTEVYTTRTITGSLQLDETVAGVLYGTAGVVGSTAALTNGQLLIGNTGNPPSVASISAGAGIAITNGAGTITIASTAMSFVFTPIAADGAMTTNVRYLNTKAALLSLSLPAVSAQGDTMILQGGNAGTTGWIITQAANQQILVGNTNTTLGAGGTLASTNKGDEVSLVCVTANLEWRVFGMVGNLTVV